MMTANYHAHTWRCSHATGTEKEYLQLAADRGMEIYGFSDHTPYPFPESHNSWFRMKLNQLPEYVETVLCLRKEFPDMQIPIGLEAEYYPAYFPELRAILRDSGVEYLLLGQHFLDNEIGAFGSSTPTSDVTLLKKYCEQSRDAIQTGLFTYFAHPDLLNFQGDSQTYREYCRGLCREAKACAVPLEINLLGLERGKHYPNLEFWRIAAEENCSVILGCDTHDPSSLLKRDSEEKALHIVNELGLNLMDRVNLRAIF